MKLSKRITAFAIVFAILAGLLPQFPFEASAAGIALPLTSQTLTPGQTYELAAGNVAGVSFTIPAGAPVTVYVNQNTLIDNTQSGASPFNIRKDGTLNLVVNQTLTVFGQKAPNGHNGSTENDGAGHQNVSGGYAAINVPAEATLNILGSGELYAYGGDAGDGGNAPALKNADSGGGGGGGGAAGIGGNGGSGGHGSQWHNTNDAQPGGAGDNAGNIRITGSLSVYAFGGGGGSGGIAPIITTGAAGAGGYPAAGIGGGGGGGGGAGGSNGGGGFTAGLAQYCVADTAYHVVMPDGSIKELTGAELDYKHASPVQNGFGGRSDEHWAAGGGYFQKGEHGTYRTPIDGGGVGGGCGDTAEVDVAGNGGSAGNGGAILICANLDNIHAYNGSYMTATDGRNYINDGVQTKPSPIYAQLGYSLNDIRARGIIDTIAYREDTSGLTSYLSNQGVASNIEPAQILGIGSGAGYTETSNGTLTIGKMHDIATGSLNIGSPETYYITRKTGFGG